MPRCSLQMCNETCIQVDDQSHPQHSRTMNLFEKLYCSKGLNGLYRDYSSLQTKQCHLLCGLRVVDFILIVSPRHIMVFSFDDVSFFFRKNMPALRFYHLIRCPSYCRMSLKTSIQHICWKKNLYNRRLIAKGYS